MQYCIKEEDIDMAMKNWQDDWRVTFLTQEIPTGKEANAGQDQTHVRDKVAPKNPKPIQKLEQQKKGGVPKKGTQAETKNTTQALKEQEKRG
jgi:hypothetical protein